MDSIRLDLRHALGNRRAFGARNRRLTQLAWLIASCLALGSTQVGAQSGPDLGGTDSLLGVYEGRTPCGARFLEFTGYASTACEKVKWWLALYQDAAGEPTRYRFDGTRVERTGRWEVERGHGGSGQPRVVYRLFTDIGPSPVALLRVDDDILLLLDGAGKPMVGDASWSYTLSRTEQSTNDSRPMADGKRWTTRNLNVDVAGSYCYDHSDAHCRRYGRLYTWEAAHRGCRALGNGWRLPSNGEWRQVARHHGGVHDDSEDRGQTAYQALSLGGSSGFDVLLGGGRAPDGQYGRLEAHGFYWTASEADSATAWFYNFGQGGQALYRHDDGEKGRAFSVRCVRD